MSLKKDQEKICLTNSLKNLAGLGFSAASWLVFASMTTIMAASIFGDMNNGRLKHKKVDLVFMTITHYQAAVICTGGLFEVSALFVAISMARHKHEDEKQAQDQSPWQ